MLFANSLLPKGLHLTPNEREVSPHPATFSGKSACATAFRGSADIGPVDSRCRFGTDSGALGSAGHTFARDYLTVLFLAVFCVAAYLTDRSSRLGKPSSNRGASLRDLSASLTTTVSRMRYGSRARVDCLPYSSPSGKDSIDSDVLLIMQPAKGAEAADRSIPRNGSRRLPPTPGHAREAPTQYFARGRPQ